MIKTLNLFFSIFSQLLKLRYFKGIRFEDAFIGSSIQELEKEFDQIDFDNIISSNQDEIIPDIEKHIELTKIVSKGRPESDERILSEVNECVDLGYVDVKQHQENVNIQFHASDFDRNSSLNDDLQKKKRMEPLQMQTKVEMNIVNVNSNSKHDSQPLDLVSSQDNKDRVDDNTADEELTIVKKLNIQTLASLNKQVPNKY